MNASQAIAIGGLLSTLVAACGGSARLSVADGTGPRPVLPPPEQSSIPVINVADATPWPEGAKPRPADGLTVEAFARGLNHPRWLYVLPNGDVLVAETNAPPRPDEGQGVKGWFFSRYQKKAGGAPPSANRITLLRDADGDGIAEVRSVLLDSLTSPFGMALVGSSLFIANTDALVWVPYAAGDVTITALPTTLVALPAGSLNHHWTKNVIASPDGLKLYVAIGSNSNVAENGLDKEEGRAALWEVDEKTGASRVFASGLRNPVGMAWEPDSGELWVAVNERDELGSDLVPDYMTAVRDGGFYGWPYSYFGQHLDPRFDKDKVDQSLVARAIVPDYALGPHTASLGLVSAKGATLPEPYSNGMFVGQHGSWNRKPRSGYKVIFIPFTDGKPAGQPIDVLAGFVTDDGHALGRPVGVAIDKRGALLVADDVGNTIWRVAGSSARLTENR